MLSSLKNLGTKGGEHPSLQCSALLSAGILECFDYGTFNIECMMKYIL